MKRQLLLAGLLAMAGAIVLPGVAAAGSTSGTEHLQLTTVNGSPGSILARGVFNAGGTFYPKGSHGDLSVFPTGAFTIHHSGGSTFTLNPKTCFLKADLSGSYTLKGGVGDYSGIDGSGTYTGTETGVFPRNPNGTCATKGQPTGLVLKVSAKGPVSFKA
jgi:hypothetical protein